MTSEAVGLASNVFLGDSQKNSSTINLLPSSKLKSLGLKQKLPYISLSLFIFSLLPLSSILKHNNFQEEIIDKKQRIEKDISILEKSINELNSFHQGFTFTQNLIAEVNLSQQPLIENSKTIGLSHEIINFIQGIISQKNIGDIWLDKFSIKKQINNNVDTRNLVNNDLVLSLSGRYLVRLNIETDESEKRDALIELDRQKKENLTAYFENIPHIEKIIKKSFSIEGKGDLFNRNFSHFEYDILLNLK